VSNEWLEIRDQEISVQEIMQRIRERIGERETSDPGTRDTEAESLAEDLYHEMLGQAMEGTALQRRVRLWRNDCDIVPRHYAIDWRVPVLGPLHALVRRVINAEIRRYLYRSLEKQSHFNRQVLEAVETLARENAALCEEIEALRQTHAGSE
jgi:hypothetical protein